MQKTFMLSLLVLATAGLLLAGLAKAHMDNRGTYENNAMAGMMNGAGMMGAHMGQAHDRGDIEQMKQEMKEHMGLTDNEINDMTEHCPMMRGAGT
ncbi:MAG: hypothetical protein HY518_05310 [Candidatus Aenigmarchaeota archaeon]|nr:hypothetical protein [Candidatus Aenigmarchaeota archaeon]